MTKKLLYIIVLFLLVPVLGFTQQLPQFTQYMYNTVSINPAYAGSREVLSIVGLNRNQWVGLSGGPVTQTLSIHAPLRNDRIGIGFSFINDQLGYENFSYVYADFSYTVPTGIDTKLSFGLKGGFSHYKIDEELFNDPTVFNDPFFQEQLNRWTPNVGAGVYYHSERWYVGLSAPRIFNNDYNRNSEYVALERVHYYLTGGYVFNINRDETVKFKPAFLMKHTNGSSLAFDFTANFLFYDKFWIGASYRLDDAVGAIADFQVNRQLRLGYAYEYPISDIRPYTSGTHEVLLIFELNFSKSRFRSPRYF